MDIRFAGTQPQFKSATPLEHFDPYEHAHAVAASSPELPHFKGIQAASKPDHDYVTFGASAK